ncbi:cytochrome b N-terminal domain-containing protein [bacterium]|nr:cytochrome b N-terminal domain-containing protein [bacterium]
MNRIPFVGPTIQWLEDRIHLRTSVQEFLQSSIPDKIGWPHVLGSILLVLFAVQFVSGILLSFVYSPSPSDAHASVRYMTEEMKGGAWLRGIHYWGASLMVIVIGLHLLRTFLFAAYRKPRELTWIVGVLLLLCVLTFAQTGFLLPWDQMAYWGTEVTIRIIGTAPLIGPRIVNFLRGGNVIGSFTLSRFYSIHTVILPITVVLLILGHLMLIRRYGIMAPWSRTGSEPPRSTSFYPHQTVKDSAAMFVMMMILFGLAAFLPPSLGSPADPSDNSIVPRPEWYFLFLFQLLHYFQGKWETVGTFFLPNLAILMLLIVPFLDRNTERRLNKRPFAVLAAAGCVFVWSYLTYAATSHQSPSRELRPKGITVSRSERIKRPSDVGGLFLLQQRCFECHSLTAAGERPLQILARNDFPAGKDWFKNHLEKMGRDSGLTENEPKELMSVLRLAAGEHSERLYTIPRVVRSGAHTFYNNFCINCHTIDGQGGKKGPDLTIRPLRSKEWHVQHIREPQSLVPNSKMQEFPDFTNAEYNALAEYILYLHSP